MNPQRERERERERDLEELKTWLGISINSQDFSQFARTADFISDFLLLISLPFELIFIRFSFCSNPPPPPFSRFLGINPRPPRKFNQKQPEEMCSNTSSGSYGGDPDDYSGSCLKKHKKERVPRRGPGVAELEKILRQQEQICTASVSASPSSSSPPSPPLFSSPYPLNAIDHTLLVPPMVPPPPLMNALFTTTPHPGFTPTPPPNPADVMPEKSPAFRLGNDVAGHRTAPVFPFSSLFSNGSFPKDLIPPAPVFQRKHHSLHQFQTMNLPNPPPPGFYQFIEPPSNQRSCVENAPQFLEEEKIAEAKRPWLFITDTSPSAQTYTKPCIGPTITIPRDAKQSRSLDLRLKSSVLDYGTTSGNPITVDSPSPVTPSTPIRTCPRDFSGSRFIPLALQYEQQEDVEEYKQRRTGKPFYSFLPSDEQSNREKDRCFSSRNEKYEANNDHGIDLSLKL
ncbi:PREDICTED: protein SPEAR4 [Tarenaya hassleriana]|uniref:protein SPEAR4 n=1 Tax=Tarenaya hassleriana TaxID=28532 RepID=UPI00053C848D|nr:PREDICTED: protein SPEAR4 [Tarenaya hassleriana]